MLQFAAPYLAIIVVCYVLKDRIKEWGKRYLQPLAGWFGVDFPDRRVRVRAPEICLSLPLRGFRLVTQIAAGVQRGVSVAVLDMCRVQPASIMWSLPLQKGVL